MDKVSPVGAASIAMWQLVECYTGSVGYKGGVKGEGLTADPPVIDCSGWVSLLLSTAMKAVNDCGRQIFSADDIEKLFTWSDRIIQEIEWQTGFILEGSEITSATLSHFTTIGLTQGGGAWAQNHPRPRGITHIVQIVRRPEDWAPLCRRRKAGPCPMACGCCRSPIGSISRTVISTPAMPGPWMHSRSCPDSELPKQKGPGKTGAF